MKTKKQKIQAVIHFVEQESDEDNAVRLANEIQEDLSWNNKSSNQQEAVKFFKKWLPTIDEEWLDQIYGSVNKVGTFSDPFCNNGQGR